MRIIIRFHCNVNKSRHIVVITLEIDGGILQDEGTLERRRFVFEGIS